MQSQTCFFLDCMCNPEGSVGNSCDQNGKCSCNANVVGDKCDQCAAGFSEFPNCDKCDENFWGFPNCTGTVTYHFFSITISLKMPSPQIVNAMEKVPQNQPVQLILECVHASPTSQETNVISPHRIILDFQNQKNARAMQKDLRITFVMTSLENVPVSLTLSVIIVINVKLGILASQIAKVIIYNNTRNISRYLLKYHCSLSMF